MESFDHKTFRAAAGQFMTGVAVVTTIDADGSPFGLTANSFTSISLDPPMVSFSLGRDSEGFPAFSDSNGFVIHVLAASQQDLSVRFATKGTDRFSGIETSPGWNGLPVIGGTLAVFECSSTHAYDGGDHVIHVGTVQRLTLGDRETPALGYFRSRYIGVPSE